MAAKLAELRKQAKEMGIAPGIIRGCNTAEELQSVIAGFGGSDDAPTKPQKKHAVAKAKKKVTKKSGNSKSTSSKSAPAAKSAKAGKAKRPTAAKASKGTDGPTGRNLLNGVDFSADEGWNPRPGSPPDRIVKALKKAKGNRSKVFDALVGEIWDFVGKKKADGSKRSKADAEAMLRYRISRTAFDFAVRTGQHEPSDNRVTYGTGGTGQGVFKRKGKGGNSKPASSKPAKSTKASTKKGATAKAGKVSTSKAKAGKKKSGKR